MKTERGYAVSGVITAGVGLGCVAVVAYSWSLPDASLRGLREVTGGRAVSPPAAGTPLHLPAVDSYGRRIPRGRPAVVIAIPPCGSCSSRAVDMKSWASARGGMPIVLLAQEELGRVEAEFGGANVRRFYAVCQAAPEVAPGTVYLVAPYAMTVEGSGRIREGQSPDVSVLAFLKEAGRRR